MAQPLQSADPQLVALRVPPHSVEAEQSVLGGLLLDNRAWDNVVGFVSAEDFYRYDHKLIHRVIAGTLAPDRGPAAPARLH